MGNPDVSVSVRLATLEDVPGLSGLLTVLFCQELEFTPDPARQAAGLEMILRHPSVGRIYCAVAGTEVVGMVSILFTVSTAQGGQAAWLEDMVVHPGWRDHGIGNRLLQDAITGARTCGCSRITLLADAGNESAMRFYGRSGFVRSSMVPLRLEL